MENTPPQWSGPSCGRHASYIFYKGFKYLNKNDVKQFSMGEFFFVRCSEDEPICIAELLLLWETKQAEGCKLCSVRLYFLPESTPQGRTERHGEDEVVAVHGKVVLKVEDLIDWIVPDVTWTYGFNAISEKDVCKKPVHLNGHPVDVVSDSIPKKENEPANHRSDSKRNSVKEQVLVLSYAKYCRYRGALKRIERIDYKSLPPKLIEALGLFMVPYKGTKIVFCRDDFEHPSLADNEKLCEHLAPKLKGRPRKKKLSVTEVNSEDSKDGQADGNLITLRAKMNIDKQKLIQTRNKSEKLKQLRRTGRKKGRPKNNEEDLFIAKLYKFMEQRQTPIDRVPSLGFRQLNLYELYNTTQQYGGYRSITNQRLWKKVYIEMGGDPGCTSAATCTRKHYERLMLPYEEYLSSLKGKKERFLAKRGRKRKNKIPGVDEESQKLGHPRKKVKKVREHLQELQLQQDMKRRVSVKLENLKVEIPDVMTVQSSSLPGNSSNGIRFTTKNDAKPLLHLNSDPYAFKLDSKEGKMFKYSNHILKQNHRRPNILSTSSSTQSKLHKNKLRTTNGIATTSQTDSVNRPSVIQHTDQSQFNHMLYVDPRRIPTDILLKQMTMHQNEVNSKDGKERPSTSQGNFQGLVFPPVVPLMRPFLPFPPAWMPQFASFPPRLPTSTAGSSKASDQQRDIKRDIQNFGDSNHVLSGSTPSQIPVIQTVPPTAIPEPVQDEPCDLSLPKKKKVPTATLR